MTMPLRIAVLAKQIPRIEDMRLGAGGRLARDAAEAETNPYCRRAIAKGVELARATAGRCTVFTLGPPQAADVLAEAIAWGADEGVLISDPAFAGSDTQATARALAAAIARVGRFDLVLTGLNSVDGDTGQVGPQLAELLDLPLLSGVRELSLDGDRVTATCERDNGFVTAALRLPALLTSAERLCQPCKVAPADRGDAAGRIRVLSAADVGGGPWGQQGSPTEVGRVRVLAQDRRRMVLAGPLTEQARHAAELIKKSAQRLPHAAPNTQVPLAGGDGPVVAVIGEPGRPRLTAELLGAAAELAAELGGSVTLCTGTGNVDGVDGAVAWAQGADTVIALRAEPRGDIVAEDVAVAVAVWARPPPGSGGERPGAPWAILAPSSSWGREVAGRLSVLLDAGLTGDAVGLEIQGGRLVSWKPAFGGQLVAAITTRSEVQLATVRAGVLPLLLPRDDGSAAGRAAAVEDFPVTPRGRVTVSDHTTNDEPERLALATSLVCVGQGVDPSRYHELRPLLDALGAELAGTRKVTDAGRLPRSRQVGITGRVVAPAVYLLLGASGKFNHMVGTRSAGLVVAVNSDADAPVFDAADIGIIGDWAEVAALLTSELADAPLDVLA
ncbi:MAG TPA: FAD-binding protein [Streptosporangiaceae bacterium]|nr:FAD-binding protein [Streptosporangiaceae bacterium]